MPFDSLPAETRPDITVLDVLREMRKKLANPKHWTQRTFARTCRGRSVEYWDPKATKWCLSGAARMCAANNDVRGLAMGIMADELVGESSSSVRRICVVTWNDHPLRTHAEVLELLDRAIARAEEKAHVCDYKNAFGVFAEVLALYDRAIAKAEEKAHAI
jgi:hypothetical protein